jgi:hypothetical protein
MSYGFYVKIDYSLIPKKLITKFKIPRKPVIYRGRNASKHFMESMISVGNKINELYKTNVPMDKLTEEEETEFQNALTCKLCSVRFDTINCIIKSVIIHILLVNIDEHYV